jgi:Arm DNA-binding domain
MSGPRRPKVGLRDLRSVQSYQNVWDGSVAGFGARRQGGSTISFILVYRAQDGRQRSYTIGKHGSPWSPDTTRQEARRILVEVVKEADPRAEKIAGRKTITVAELCRQYPDDVEAMPPATFRDLCEAPAHILGSPDIILSMSPVYIPS